MIENPFDDVGCEPGKTKKASNKETNLLVLKAAGVTYRTNNDGVHCIITVKGNKYDFWPTKGKWYHRQTKLCRTGVFKLLAHIRNLDT